MHRFQPSRGRILFEVSCALAVVASMVGAWQQTQASALLTAAAAAGLYAMVRLFDLGRHDPVQIEEPQRMEFEPEPEVRSTEPAAPAAFVAAVEPLRPVPATAVEEPEPAAPATFLAAVEPLAPVLEPVDEEPELVEPAPRSGGGRRKGGSRKSAGRRASTPKVAEVIEFAPAEEAAPAPPVHVEEPEVAVEPVAEESQFEAPVADEVDLEAPEFTAEPAQHVPHAPLFEPEPFVRMPRAAFGRRGRL